MNPVESPCVKLCKLEGEKCVGCGRTKFQITHWMKIEASERRRIMDELGKTVSRTREYSRS
jgi:predicted Fe-S protein YdhL (DUF1289 family)